MSDFAAFTLAVGFFLGCHTLGNHIKTGLTHISQAMQERTEALKTVKK